MRRDKSYKMEIFGMNFNKLLSILIFASIAVLSLQNISLASLSAELSVTIAARLKSLEVIDGDNSARRSFTTLQMVSKDEAMRNAIVNASKDNMILDWPLYEPVWTGLLKANGTDSVTVSTAQTGFETAKVGDETKTVTIEIFAPDKQEFTFAGKETVNKISLFAERLASTFSISAGGDDHPPLSISASREWVDKYADPRVARKVNVTLTGSTQRFKASTGVPGYSLDLPLIKIGLFLNADIGANADMSYTYDPSRPAVDSITAIGSVTVDGSIGAEAKAIDLKGNLDWRILIGATFEIPAEISAEFIKSDPENPSLTSTGSVGPAEVKIEVEVQVGEFEWRLDKGTWEVIEKTYLWGTPKE